MYYYINLFRGDEDAVSLWRAKVGFEYQKRRLSYSDDYFESLGESLKDLEVHHDQATSSSGVSIQLDSKPLDQAFAKDISDTLRPFIEAITSTIDEFEDERSNQEDI